MTFQANTLETQVGTVQGPDVVAQGTAQNGSVPRPLPGPLPGPYEATINYVLQDDEPGAAQGQVVSIKQAGHGHVDVDILQSGPLSAGKTVSHHPFVVTNVEEVAVRVRFPQGPERSRSRASHWPSCSAHRRLPRRSD